MRRSLGIDLGTTNSVAACNAQVLLLLDGFSEAAKMAADRRALEGNSTYLLPSVVSFLPNGGAVVGEEARRRRPIDPLNTVYTSKRLMGEQWTSYATRKFAEQYPHRLAPCLQGAVQFETRAGAIKPADVAALIVSHLCMRSGVH